MLKVSATQFAEFERNKEKHFYRSLGEELREYASRHLPEIEPHDRVPRIRHVFQLCRHYGIETERDITRLSYILLAFPSDFFEHPQYKWVHQILTSPEPATARVDRVSAILRS